MLVHGGASSQVKNREARNQGVSEALNEGWAILEGGGSSVDAVEAAITTLEDNKNFNAGRGSLLQLDGIARMDASIMEGEHRNAGAVAAMEGIANPIKVARLVMEKTPHILLVGKKAKEFALHYKVKEMKANTNKRAEYQEKALKKGGAIVKIYKEIFGTVGAVAIDSKNLIAAGASTGGILGMLPGRVGDSPLIGCGIYADNSVGGVSMTGTGEKIIRMTLARNINYEMANGYEALSSVKRALREMLISIGGEAGAIAIKKDGDFGIAHTTKYMFAGYKTETEGPYVSDRFKIVQK